MGLMDARKCTKIFGDFGVEHFSKNCDYTKVLQIWEFIECLRISWKVNAGAPANENLDWGGSNLQVQIFLSLEWIACTFVGSPVRSLAGLFAFSLACSGGCTPVHLCVFVGYFGKIASL